MTIKDRLVPLICKHLKTDAARVVPEARFRQDLKADSLALILLQFAIEEEFNIEISEKDSKGIVSLETTIEYLASQGIKD